MDEEKPNLQEAPKLVAPMSYSVQDLLDLMAGMEEYRIGLMELPGGYRFGAIVTPNKGPAPDAAASKFSMGDAQLAAQRSRKQQAELREQQKARLTQRAVGGIGAGTGGAVEKIYRDAVSTPPAIPEDSGLGHE